MNRYDIALGKDTTESSRNGDIHFTNGEPEVYLGDKMMVVGTGNMESIRQLSVIFDEIFNGYSLPPESPITVLTPPQGLVFAHMHHVRERIQEDEQRRPSPGNTVEKRIPGKDESIRHYS